MLSIIIKVSHLDKICVAERGQYQGFFFKTFVEIYVVTKQ